MHKAAECRGRRLVFVSPQPRVRSVLEILGFVRSFTPRPEDRNGKAGGPNQDLPPSVLPSAVRPRNDSGWFGAPAIRVGAKRRATRGPAPKLTAELLHVRRRHTGPLKKGAVNTRTDNVRGRTNNGWASTLG
jgi:hypothetical protein